MDPRDACKQFTVVGERLVRELQGTSCLPLNAAEPDRKNIQVTRSFGKPLTDYEDVAEAIAYHATTLGENLRKRNLKTPVISVFCRTGRFGHTDRYYGTEFIGFATPTHDTQELLSHALTALQKCFRKGYIYKAAGIQAYDLRHTNSPTQLTLFAPLNKQKTPPTALPVSKNGLNGTLDDLNKRFGRKTVFQGACGLSPKHQTKMDMRTPRYTTRWDEFLVVKCE